MLGDVDGAEATDNCAGQVTATTADPTTYSAQGAYLVHWSYSDGHGNVSTQNQAVVVKDTIAPTILTCPPAASALAGTGCVAAVPDLRASLSAVDNCTPAGSLVITQLPAPGTPEAPGVATIGFTVTDAVGNSSSCSTTFTVSNDAPVVTSVTGPTVPLAIGIPATVTAQFTDTGLQGHTCTFTWDDGSQSSVSVAAGVTTCSDTHTYTGASVNTISVTVADDCTAASDPGVFQFVVVYDPNAGFVTGGGFIYSPPGAYAADASLVGKANFGFVSKYLKGAKVPTGSTEFQFQVASFNFHSDVYQWLVISGPLAQYKGTGTVNGAGNYGFILTATDGQINGGGGVDKFRIKISDINAGNAIVYDNSPGSSDDINSANPEAIAGGSIVIHKN